MQKDAIVATLNASHVLDTRITNVPSLSLIDNVMRTISFDLENKNLSPRGKDKDRAAAAQPKEVPTLPHGSHANGEKVGSGVADPRCDVQRELRKIQMALGCHVNNPISGVTFNKH